MNNLRCNKCGGKRHNNGLSNFFSDGWNYAIDKLTRDGVYTEMCADITQDLILDKFWEDFLSNLTFSDYVAPTYDDVRTIIDTYINIQLDEQDRPVFDKAKFSLNKELGLYSAMTSGQDNLITRVAESSTRTKVLVIRTLSLLFDYAGIIKTTKYLDPRNANEYKNLRETPDIVEGGLLGMVGLSPTKIKWIMGFSVLGLGIYGLGKATDVYKVIKGS